MVVRTLRQPVTIMSLHGLRRRRPTGYGHRRRRPPPPPPPAARVVRCFVLFLCGCCVPKFDSEHVTWRVLLENVVREVVVPRASTTAAALQQVRDDLGVTPRFFKFEHVDPLRGFTLDSRHQLDDALTVHRLFMNHFGVVPYIVTVVLDGVKRVVGVGVLEWGGRGGCDCSEVLAVPPGERRRCSQRVPTCRTPLTQWRWRRCARCCVGGAGLIRRRCRRACARCTTTCSRPSWRRAESDRWSRTRVLPRRGQGLDVSLRASNARSSFARCAVVCALW